MEPFIFERIQCNEKNVILVYSALDKVIIEDFGEKVAFSTSSDACDDFDTVIEFQFDKSVQVSFPFNHHYIKSESIGYIQ